MIDNIKQHELASIRWRVGATLRNTNGSASLGFAGPISGVSNQAYLFAGGANFPDRMPWQGGSKAYSDRIFVFQRSAGKLIEKEEQLVRLPESIAYCGSVSTDYGIVYAGGENEQGLSKKAFILSWNESAQQVELDALPSLPLALSGVALTRIGEVIYVLGGDGAEESSAAVFSMDLSRPERSWERLPDMPRPAAYLVAVAQDSPAGYQLFAVGGRAKTVSGISELYADTFAFNLQTKRWSALQAISDGIRQITLSAGTALALGQASIVLFGGDDGAVFHRIESYLNQIASATDAPEKADMTEAKNQLVTKHPGFYNGILHYDTFANRWTKISEFPYPVPVCTGASLWNHEVLIPSGETRPGKRSPDIICGSLSLP